MKYNIYLFLLIVLCVSCGEDYIPKPKAFLRLDYPEHKYSRPDFTGLPFSFETNKLATEVNVKPMRSSVESYGVDLQYPSMKGTIFITYKAVNNDKKVLEKYLRDAEKLTIEHMIKAEEVPPMFPFENKKERVYGVFSEVKGDVASPAQFYVTDSVNHFLTGSLYFYAKPNYDSILPAANYLEKDIQHIMETLRWK
ncbi:gliding motility lipoprotein GldD [Aestuariibaculum suncheonense]|uniref:Gliding motility lipoprotein GldD n=1 Tax=Aestuariibaculum suncheonense TaxID=1028745 RepID=A0A8J6UIC5_9FLAO|nr:gliding motility lipoprotein GldD [Aestuariibaculum suncheonense]MBD0834046.1 gliding motility lipoprotein GldD [Aestuariibaculum suncheonense]